MSANFTKSPIWVAAVIVGLIVATALVAGYVDRPGTGAQVAAADSECAGCPLEGTPACCREAGTCAKGCCDADAAGSPCAAGAASTCAAGAATCAQPAESAGSTCPMKAATAGGCTGGQCPAMQ